MRYGFIPEPGGRGRQADKAAAPCFGQVDRVNTRLLSPAGQFDHLVHADDAGASGGVGYPAWFLPARAPPGVPPARFAISFSTRQMRSWPQQA